MVTVGEFIKKVPVTKENIYSIKAKSSYSKSMINNKEWTPH